MMPKAHAKNGKTTKSQEQALFRQWNDERAIADDCAGQIIDAFYSRASASARECLRERACGAGRLDPALFERYRELTACYENIVLGYDKAAPPAEPDSGSPKLTLTKMAEGIRSVLVSRIRNFQDKFSSADNPVAAEKKEIVEGALLRFSRRAAEMAEARRKERLSALSSKILRVFQAGGEYTEALAAAEGFLAAESAFAEERFSAAFKETAARLEGDLSNTEKYRLPMAFWELLNQDEQLLKSIVKTQKPAIMQALDTSPAAVGERVSLLLRGVTAVADGLSSALAELDAPHSAFVSQEASPLPEISAEELLPAPFFHDRMEDFLKKHSELSNAALAEINAQIRDAAQAAAKGFSLKTRYETQKCFALTDMAAAEIKAAFEGVHARFAENSAVLSAGGFAEIIVGIDETITIKIESIDENCEFFREERDEFLKTRLPEPPPLAEEEADSAAREVFAGILNALTEALSGGSAEAETIKTGLAAASERGALLRTPALERLERQTAEETAKKINKFLREQLLFEISTFEEIINYSVSLLRESGDAAVISYVAAIDAAKKMIDDILSKNNIETIRPSPHDQFNGREHEAMLAEVNPDFAKGEIIRLMNSGYRRDGAVIIRANVIAGK